MAVDVRTEIVIARPVDAVAGFAADPSNATTWYRRISAVRWVTEPPVQVGTRTEFVAHFLGRRLVYTYEVVELVPGRRLTMRTAEGPFPMRTTYTWDPVGDSVTRMTLRNTGEPSGFARVAGAAVAAAMRRANEADLALLKHLLEQGR